MHMLYGSFEFDMWFLHLRSLTEIFGVWWASLGPDRRESKNARVKDLNLSDLVKDSRCLARSLFKTFCQPTIKLRSVGAALALHGTETFDPRTPKWWSSLITEPENLLLTAARSAGWGCHCAFEVKTNSKPAICKTCQGNNINLSLEREFQQYLKWQMTGEVAFGEECNGHN